MFLGYFYPHGWGHEIILTSGQPVCRGEATFMAAVSKKQGDRIECWFTCNWVTLFLWDRRHFYRGSLKLPTHINALSKSNVARLNVGLCKFLQLSHPVSPLDSHRSRWSQEIVDYKVFLRRFLSTSYDLSSIAAFVSQLVLTFYSFECIWSWS
jgi:hypothetical protein